MNDYVISRLDQILMYAKEVKKAIQENDLLRSDSTALGCQIIILNAKEALRKIDQLQIKKLLNEKEPF